MDCCTMRRPGRGKTLTIGLLLVLATCTEERTPTAPTRAADVALDPSGAVTLVGAGEIARCDSLNDEATAAALDTIPGLVFTAGDNIIDNGSATDFTKCYGPGWGRQLARTLPALGDKEYQTAGAAGGVLHLRAAPGGAPQSAFHHRAGAGGRGRVHKTPGRGRR